MVNKSTEEKAKEKIDTLYRENDLDDNDLKWLLENLTDNTREYLYKASGKTRDKIYGKNVYLRGLIEFTNYCKKDCKYCGINVYNKNISRYRLEKEEILSICKDGYDKGFRTFVLQGGEDPYFTDDILVDIIKKIKFDFPQAAITLSVGERSFESYRALKEAGADRYLLRHETYDCEIFKNIHGSSKLDERITCLKNLKSLNYQTGAGFMVGLKGYEKSTYVKDLRFLKEFEPQMVGIGPFIAQKDTQMAEFQGGSIETTLDMLALVRLLLPRVLMPATTALATISPNGRKKGLDVGANVIMPNLTPIVAREKYKLYDGKKILGDEASEQLDLIKEELTCYGYILDMSRGDSKMVENKLNSDKKEKSNLKGDKNGNKKNRRKYEN